MMDMIERRMSIMRESEEDKEMTWETLIDYTFNEELGITDTYHDVMNVDATFFEKCSNAKKIIIASTFESPSEKVHDGLGDINIGLYTIAQGWFPFTFVRGNYLPNNTSGYASKSGYYKEIDLTNVCELGKNNYLTVYTPSVFKLKNDNPQKLDEFFAYDSMFNGNTVLRVINTKVPIGKGSRIRVLVAS